MKKKILLLMSVFTFSLLQAQVGVNTTTPLGWFHVDPDGTTGGTAAAPINDADDVIVTTDGRVGVGTANPSTKLHIATGGTATAPIAGFKLVDGYQGNGRFLMSDANGVGVWTNLPSNTSTVIGAIADVTTNYNPPTSGFVDLKRSLNLSAGRWLVYIGIQIRNAGMPSTGGVFVRATLATDTSGGSTGMTHLQGQIVSAYMDGAALFKDRTMTGVTLINLTAAQTVYLGYFASSFFGTATSSHVVTSGNSPENYLFAIPVL